MGCISSGAELMQGDSMKILNVALGSGLNVGACNFCGYL